MKDTFASFANRCTCPPDLPVCVCGKEPVLDVVTRKPRLPNLREVERNPRALARSCAWRSNVNRSYAGSARARPAT